MTDTALESLEKRVHAGAGLALFLGPQLKPAFANQKLHRAQQPTEGLLPLEMKSVGTGRPEALANIRWTHPLLASLRDPVLSDFTQSRYRGHANLVGALGKNDAVLARFDDDVPAILERPFGAGRVLVFNTSANDEWSDLPKRKSFVPLVDGMLTYLSAGGVQRNFKVGDRVTLPLPNGQAKSEATVVAPSGTKFSPRMLVLREQSFLHFEEVAEVGAYRIEGVGKKGIVFTVNAPRIDSSLEGMNAKTLEEWWSPVAFEIVGADSARQQLDQQSSRWPLWPALVTLAGVLLVAETVYVHRLCPRANPKAADAVVPQRGMMKPIDGMS